MTMIRRSLLAALALAGLAACAAGPGGRGAAPVSLAGAWSFRIDTGGGRITLGRLQLAPAAGGYAGTLTTNRGDNVLPVPSFTVLGAEVRMRVESPQGAVTFAGALTPGARAFTGTLTYHDGQRFPLSATKD